VEAERSLYVGDIYSIDAMGARDAGLVPVILDPTGAYGALDCTVIGRLSELLGLGTNA
jgi:FMN phosphatase YigB (HAD superfamily)